MSATEALGLPFVVIHAGTDAAMFAELEFGLSAQGADHAVGLFPALGAGQIRGRMGRVPRAHAGVLHRSRNGASIPTRPMTAASRMAKSGNTAWAGMKDKWPVAYKVAKAYHDRGRRAQRAERRGGSRRQDHRRRGGRLGRGERGDLARLGAIEFREAGRPWLTTRPPCFGRHRTRNVHAVEATQCAAADRAR